MQGSDHSGASHDSRPPSHPRSFAGFVILCDSYVSNSAGIGCLYRLCDELNKRGHSAFMTGGLTTAPHLNAPIVDEQMARVLCAHGYIAIYPESISGNPLEATTVVRWVLNRPGLLGGDDVYDDREHVFSYSDVFSPYIKNRIAGKLYMPTIDESLFYCEDADLSTRSLECFYVGKSHWKDGVIDGSQAFGITRESPAKRDLGKIFRAARVLYCFDNSTILIYEALLCGCPVVVIPDGTQTKQDFEQLELGLNGISWGLEEFRGEPVDVGGLRARYEQVKLQFQRQLDCMIDVSHASATRRRRTPAPDISALQKKTWYRTAGETLLLGVRRLHAYSRSVERSVRRFRKYCVNQLRKLFVPPTEPFEDDGSYFCTDWDLSKRHLECYFIGDCRWHDGLFERDKALEIVPATPASQLGKLFRASRAFYTFDGQTRLIGAALNCGCPVILIDKDGQPQTLHAQVAAARAA